MTVGSNEPSLVNNATWTLGAATTSRIAGHEFEHERGCSIDSRTTRGNLHCDCYLSRVRIITSPLGDELPTFEPDLSGKLAAAKTTARFWYLESETFRKRLLIISLVALAQGAWIVLRELGVI